MPRAISRPREPDGMVSMSTFSRLPRRMIEPLPKWRSICESAASRAFDLSMEGLSTSFKTLEDIAVAPGRVLECRGIRIHIENTVHVLFSLARAVVGERYWVMAHYRKSQVRKRPLLPNSFSNQYIQRGQHADATPCAPS